MEEEECNDACQKELFDAKIGLLVSIGKNSRYDLITKFSRIRQDVLLSFFFHHDNI